MSLHRLSVRPASLRSSRLGRASALLLILLPALATQAFPEGSHLSTPTPLSEAGAPQQELEQRLAAEQAAVAQGDRVSILAACRQVVASAISQLADIRAQQGEPAEALALARTAAATEPTPAHQLDLAAAMIMAGDVSAGRELAAGVLENDPGNARAQQLARGEKLPPAPGEDHQPDSPSSLAREGMLRHVLSVAYSDWGIAVIRQQQDYSGALLLFEAAAHWDPTVPGTMRNLGLAAFRLGRYDESAEAFSTVAAAEPKDAQVHVLLGLSLFSLKKFPGAAAAFAPAADAAMADSHAAYAWAFSLAHVPDPQQANRILDQLVTRPLAPDDLSLVCQVFEQTENYEHAISCLQKLEAADPSRKRVHYGIGISLIHLSRAAEALPELRAELALSPHDPDVQFYYAYALIETSQKAEAQAMLAEVTEEDPTNGQAQYQLGKLLAEQQQWPQAIVHLQAAEVADQQSATPNFDIHYQLQSAYRKTGQNQDAARELEMYKSIKASARTR